MIRTFPRIGAYALVVTMFAPSAFAQAEKKPAAKPVLYDTKADARVLVDTAVAKARKENTRVLVMFGFNTCGWCHKLHGLFETNAAIKKLLHDEYTLVMVDTSAPHFKEVLEESKAALSAEESNKSIGYPFLAVYDGKGKAITAQRTDPLEEGDHHDPKKVQEFLAKWVATPQDAREVLATALARAKSEDKEVFLHFGAPWCGWCHKLDDFLAKDDITKIVDRDYIDLKIDVDRMTNGKDVLAKYRTAPDGGIPWIAILDADGKTLVTSDAKTGNIGYPAQPEEIEHFLSMLAKTRKRIEPAQIDEIKKSLETEAAKLKAPTRRVTQAS